MEPGSNVVVIEHPRAEPSRAVNIIDLLDRAMSTNASADTLEKLYELQMRHEARKCLLAFDAALAKAKGEFGPLIKNTAVDFTNKAGVRTNYQYEDLAGIAAVVDGPLAANGLAYRFKTSAEIGQPIIVTCVVFGHGHREETSLPGPRDESGQKNQHQALGSGLTYLERYALKAALGIASGKDDDGRAAGALDRTPPQGGPGGPVEDTGEIIDAEQASEIKLLIVQSGAQLPAFLARFHIPDVDSMPVAAFANAIRLLKLKIANAAAGMEAAVAAAAVDYAKASKGE